MGERFLVVISTLEGRGFPKRPRHKIVAEARFDGELLSTDPVDHVDTPDFTQELAWELDKKALQQHRLQRTSIKIQCFALDPNTGLKEPIGYVILDVRSAIQNKQAAKWYPLLHCKYAKSKPEVRLSLYLDDDKSPQKEGTLKVIGEKVNKSGSAVAPSVNMKSLVPVLNDQEGYYQLGPAHSCSDHFVLSVTIAYANNLPQLIPSTMPLSAASSGYFFYYSLLGNDVTNETFADLVNPAFPAERASVRVRSSVDALRMFFFHQPGLQIHLCCGDQSLGSCEVPLKSLLKKDSTEIYMKPVSVEGDFQLVPPNKVKQQIPAVPTSLSPVVGVSVVLRKEDMGAVTPVKDHANNAALPLSGTTSPILKSSPHKHSPPQRDGPGREKKEQEEQTKLKQGDGGDGEKGEDYSDSFEEETHNSASLGEQVKKMAGQRQESQSTQPGPSQPSNTGSGAVNSMSTSEVHHAIPAQAHHFTFALDLRSIRDHVSPNTVFLFVRYTYPFFGSAAPILTHPPVEIRKGSEVLLPQSFCAFDFACTMQQLQDTFRRVPLTVEVWQRDKQLSKDVLLGTARLPLSHCLTAQKMRTMGANNTPGWRQEYSDRVPVTATEGPVQQCADISLVMTLEDWGPITPPVVSNDSASLPYSSQVVQAPVSVQGSNSFPTQQELPASPRQTSEYQVALELEIWKETQQQTFEKELKQKESQYMRALAEEWKKRDKEREVLMQKKLTEYTQWEGQLKKTLGDLEKRDKQLAANEHEVSRLRGELQREHDRKLQEMKEASRRMKDDCDHQVELERMKVKEMEEMINRYKGEVQDGDRKYKALEKEFSTFKEQLNSKPEVRLQSEINLLTLEKVELERKLEAANQSKGHYKQQWGRALKEVARLKQREQEMAKASLRQQQQELEHMRLRYLAAEEKDVARTDNQELEAIKNELNKLKQLEAEKLKQTSDSNLADSGHKPLNTDMNSSMDEHISRLVEERDTLLRTGVYTTQDKIIVELDRQIREAISQRNR